MSDLGAALGEDKVDDDEVMEPAAPEAEASAPVVEVDDLEVIADAAEQFHADHGSTTIVEDGTIRLVEPVVGDPGLVVLRILGLAQDAAAVGAAVPSPGGGAIGVWTRPDLYLARWTKGARWVVGFRIPNDFKLNTYVRTEGRIPTRLETGNWYTDVPAEVIDAFVTVGLLVDEPPFDVPPPAVPVPATARPRATPSPRAARPAKAKVTKAAKPPTTRLCPSCRMHRSLSQFVADSDLCVDCR